MGDLAHGTFTVVGKVIRVLSGEEEAVSLIRNTPLERMPSSTLNEMFGKLNSLVSTREFWIPRSRVGDSCTSCANSAYRHLCIERANDRP